jgi:predicted Rossmann fold flavoprotein
VKIAIVGGGASGVFCGIKLAENKNATIHIYEKSSELLKKVKISGGGRCNVTHQYISPAQFTKNYPRGAKIQKNNFDVFSPNDLVYWFQKRGIALKIEKDGRIFPTTNSSQTIIDCFQKELNKPNISVFLNTEIQDIKRENNNYTITSTKDAVIYDIVVIATGGAQKERELNYFNLSLPHTTISTVPSLFTFKIDDKELTQLMGLSVQNAQIKIITSAFKEIGPLLITHWGLSGPAILKLSAWGAFFLHEKKYQFEISVNWLGDEKELDVQKRITTNRQLHGNALVTNFKPEPIPNRLWEYFLSKAEINPSKKWRDLSKKDENKLIQLLTNNVYTINGKTTFKDEFVTAGGIDTQAINTQTMESLTYPKLYFIGEVLNIDGITGGFNFQNAWTSAIVAAKHILSKDR